MLTHRRTLGLFLGGVALLVAAHTWWGTPLWPLLIWSVCYVLVLAWGSCDPSLGFFIRHRTSGEKDTLALTYDDGPHPVHTPALLDLLRTEHVHATFFCIGREVERYPAIARRIVDEGHSIGIHTQDHRWNWGFLNVRDARGQIERCAAAITAATGTTPVLFRPPFGVTSPATATAIRQCGVRPIGWDLRTFDTLHTEAARVMRRIDRRLPNSTIVLLHDTRPFTVELTRAILARCRQRGTRLVKVTADP